MSCNCEGGTCRTSQLEQVLTSILDLKVDLNPPDQFFNEYNRGQYYGRLKLLEEIKNLIGESYANPNPGQAPQ
jgi:hypothetical protein